MSRRAPSQLQLCVAAPAPKPARGFFADVAAQARASGELFLLLGWSLPAPHAGEVAGLKSQRKAVTLYAPTFAQLLAQVERAEVARRAVHIERDYTRSLAEELGWSLTRGRRGSWRAEHLTSLGTALEAPSAAELRALLRTTVKDPAPELPWGSPEDAVEVPHG